MLGYKSFLTKKKKITQSSWQKDRECVRAPEPTCMSSQSSFLAKSVYMFISMCKFALGRKLT